MMPQAKEQLRRAQPGSPPTTPYASWRPKLDELRCGIDRCGVTDTSKAYKQQSDLSLTSRRDRHHRITNERATHLHDDTQSARRYDAILESSVRFEVPEQGCCVCDKIALITNTRASMDDKGRVHFVKRDLPISKSKSTKASVTATDSNTNKSKSDNRKRFPQDEIFNDLLLSIEDAIANGIHPVLIPRGSSGSYFARATDYRVVGVFKPKSEEPFARLNPKWPKTVQRLLCPCCFGRKCLLSNHGYLSEVGASMIDDFLELSVVPKTRLVWLASTAFHYPKSVLNKQGPLPPKIGSLQVFLEEYEHAAEFLRRLDAGLVPLDEHERQHLCREAQKMMILDYIIRNTDRSQYNWMIKYKPRQTAVESDDIGLRIKVAAIDNGLAFPVCHPIEESYWRPFPYGWVTLTFAQEPFDDSLAIQLLAKLDEPLFISTLCESLKLLFKYDIGYNPAQCRSQLSVVRGQMFNAQVALRNRYKPVELAKMSLQVAVRKSLPESQRQRLTDKSATKYFCAEHCRCVMLTDNRREIKEKSVSLPHDHRAVVCRGSTTSLIKHCDDYYQIRPVTETAKPLFCCSIM